MKYVLMYVSRPDLEAAVPPERQQEVYAQIYAWFGEHGSVIADNGAELQGPETATTIRSGGDGAAPVVIDGPFSEAKENIGGFSVIDVPDLDAAIALVKTWPSLALPGVSVEIRPMVEDYSEFEQS
ncbi:MAG TPA: YciI family protein [Microlunatus sp.]